MRALTAAAVDAIAAFVLLADVNHAAVVSAAAGPADKSSQASDYCSGWSPEAVLDWPPEREAWCCQQGLAPCREAYIDPLQFDCGAESVSQWSAVKRRWCCKREGAGCERSFKGPTTTTTPVPFDCLAGLEDWRSTWSQRQQTWCCQFEHRGCASTPVDTVVALDTPEDCIGIECPPPTPAVSSAVSPLQLCKPMGIQMWSDEKKAVCCRYVGLGCASGELPGGGTCFKEGAVYEPRETDSTPMTIEASALQCQFRCSQVEGCERFSYWTEGRMCYIQGASAIEMVGGDGFVAGPARCVLDGATTLAPTTPSTPAPAPTTTLPGPPSEVYARTMLPPSPTMPWTTAGPELRRTPSRTATTTLRTTRRPPSRKTTSMTPTTTTPTTSTKTRPMTSTATTTSITTTTPTTTTLTTITPAMTFTTTSSTSTASTTTSTTEWVIKGPLDGFPDKAGEAPGVGGTRAPSPGSTSGAVLSHSIPPPSQVPLSTGTPTAATTAAAAPTTSAAGQGAASTSAGARSKASEQGGGTVAETTTPWVIQGRVFGFPDFQSKREARGGTVRIGPLGSATALAGAVLVLMACAAVAFGSCRHASRSSALALASGDRRPLLLPVWLCATGGAAGGPPSVRDYERLSRRADDPPLEPDAFEKRPGSQGPLE